MFGAATFLALCSKNTSQCWFYIAGTAKGKFLIFNKIFCRKKFSENQASIEFAEKLPIVFVDFFFINLCKSFLFHK